MYDGPEASRIFAWHRVLEEINFKKQRRQLTNVLCGKDTTFLFEWRSSKRYRRCFPYHIYIYIYWQYTNIFCSIQRLSNQNSRLLERNQRLYTSASGLLEVFIGRRAITPNNISIKCLITLIYVYYAKMNGCMSFGPSLISSINNGTVSPLFLSFQIVCEY